MKEFYVLDKSGHIRIKVRKLKAKRFQIESFDVIDNEVMAISIFFTKKELLNFIENLKTITND